MVFSRMLAWPCVAREACGLYYLYLGEVEEKEGSTCKDVLVTAG